MIPQPASARPTASGVWRRYAIVTAVVAAWMALGWAFQLNGNAYLLVGVPLLVLFQRLVARQPLFALWFAEPGTARLPAWGWLIVALFSLMPLHELTTWQNPGWEVRLWLVCALAGTYPLALSLARCRREQWIDLVLCLVTAGGVGLFAVFVAFFTHHRADWTALDRLTEAGRSLLLYIPVCFVLEEVFFRGGLDSSLARDRNPNAWVSAFYLSALWGWWHLPLLSPHPGQSLTQFLIVVIVLPLSHGGVGALLSCFWRRSGLLLVPVFAHAFIDAVRKRGALVGAALGFWRIMRCNPWSKGGYDPVPKRHGNDQ